MANTKDLIIKLKEVREEKNLSYTDILDLMEKNGDYLSKTTISRVFAEGSEDTSFKYEETLRPIAKALLDIETIEDTDNLDLQAMKSLLIYKIQRIKDLEKQVSNLEISLAQEEIKSLKKIEEIREQSSRSIEFLKEQVSLKDKRMDLLLEAVYTKDSINKELLEHIINCPYKSNCGEKV